MARDSGGGNGRNQASVPDVVQQQSSDTFYTNGPSDPRQYAGRNGVDEGPVPLSHWTSGAGAYAVAEGMGRSIPEKGLRPERQTKEEQRQTTPVQGSYINRKLKK